MIIVLGTATLGEGALEQGRAAMAAMCKASNAEEGCVSYAYAQDVNEPARLVIVERWKDEEALKAHFAEPHMATFRKAIGKLDVTITEVLKYEADDGAPLL